MSAYMSATISKNLNFRSIILLGLEAEKLDFELKLNLF